MSEFTTTKAVIAVCVALCVALPAPVAAATDELVTLMTRDGVEQRFILVKPDKVNATVILFAGGSGKLGLSGRGKDYEITHGNNFLVRARDLFARHGLMVAVPDAPSDRQSGAGMRRGYRTGHAHLKDIDAIIAYLREQSPAPIWLVGASRGVLSAAHIATRARQEISGLILAAPVTKPGKHGVSALTLDLEAVTVPTLIVAHAQDACHVSPPRDALKLVRRFTNAPRTMAMLLTGGNAPMSRPCKARSYHGFFGLEARVVEYMAGFIGGD